MSTRARLLDSCILLLAVGVVLSVLDDSFTSRSAYLIAGLLPAALLIGLAWALKGRAGGGGLYGAVAVLMYAPAAALVALRDPGPYLVPVPAAMARALGGTVSGPLELVGTLPPVDTSGVVMMVPFFVGFATTGAAAWLTVATDRALAPVVPLLAGLASAIALGSLVPRGLLVRGACLAGLLLWWGAVRARRTQDAVGAGRGAAGQAVSGILVVALVSALGVLLVPDDIEVDRVLLRGQLAPSIEADDLNDPFLADTRPSDPRVLLRTTGVPTDTPLRFAALDLYTEAGWVAAGESPGGGASARFQRVGSEIEPLHPGPEVDVRIQVQPAYVSDWLPIVGELTSLDLDYTDGRTQLSEVRYNQATATAFVVGGVDPRDDYTLTAVVERHDPDEEVQLARATGAQRQAVGAFLDPYLERWAGGSTSAYDAWQAFMARLVRFGSIRLRGAADDLEPESLSRFLAPPSVVGTPHQYAAIAALAASRLGIPGRVVVGARTDEDGLVHTNDVTSWVEIQVADGSWRRVEPRAYLGTRRIEGGGAGPGGAGGVAGPGAPVEEGDLDIPKGADVDIPPGTPLPTERDRWRLVVWALVTLVAAAGSVLLLVPMAKLVRRRIRRSRRPSTRRYVGGWQELVDAARDLRHPVPDHLGRVPQARLLGDGLLLARRVDDAVFSPDAPESSEAAEFWRDVMLTRREISRRHPRRRRVWAWFSPASLVASVRRRSAGLAPVSTPSRATRTRTG